MPFNRCDFKAENKDLRITLKQMKMLSEIFVGNHLGSSMTTAVNQPKKGNENALNTQISFTVNCVETLLRTKTSPTYALCKKCNSFIQRK